MNKDEQLLSVFKDTPRLSFDEIILKAKMQRMEMLQSLTRLVDKGILRRNKVRGGSSGTTYFELRNQK